MKETSGLLPHNSGFLRLQVLPVRGSHEVPTGKGQGGGTLRLDRVEPIHSTYPK